MASRDGHRPPLCGDEPALFRRIHAQLVRRTLRRTGCSQELAEDACAHAWLQFLRHQPDRRYAFAWLTLVARHEAYRLQPKETASTHRGVGPEPSLCDGMVLAERVADPRDTEVVLEAKEALGLLARLKDGQRRVLSLRAAGHRYEEIVALTGRTYTWVNRNATEGRRAARKLRDAA